MSEPIYRGGGFGSVQLSDEAQRTVADNEARERQEAHSARLAEQAFNAHNGIRDEEQRRATWEANNERLAVQMAVEEGYTALDVARGKWGHTRHDVIARAEAQQDHEDRMQEVRERRAFEAWKRDNAGHEVEPTRAERIQASREARDRAWLEERRGQVEERRAQQAREAEIRKIAGQQLEPVIARMLTEIEGSR